MARSAETGDVDTGLERHYYVVISNESSWMRLVNFVWRFSRVELTKDGTSKNCILTIADFIA